MEKDKLIKNFGSAKNSLKNLFLTFPNLIEKLIDKINLIDPGSNIKQRVISAIVLIPIALYAIFYSKSLFFFLAIAITIIMTSEWLDIIKSTKDQKKWRLIGLFYILVPIYSVIKIRLFSSDILFWMFAIIWSTDIFAFFAGKILGGSKLAPKISPNKTWSGLIGGVLASMIIGLLSSIIFSGEAVFFILISGLLAIVEQISDLLESKFKRIFGVKDSSNIIPGHGGILDRLDGMMLVAPLTLFLITVFADKFL